MLGKIEGKVERENRVRKELETQPIYGEATFIYIENTHEIGF